MAYEQTEVAVSKSQEQIRKQIMAHNGFGIAFVSEAQPDGSFRQEGFHAKVFIEQRPYSIRVLATLKKSRKSLTQYQQAAYDEQECRRIWRVLYHHIKSVFEASDSGVMEFRELMLPYIVMPNGSTIAENILPQLDAKLAGNPDRLLTAGVQ